MQSREPLHYLSTEQAAQVLGVSVSTVKRWVDEGVVPAHKTAGGHRKLLRAEVLALARQGDLPRGNPAALHVPPAKEDVDLDALASTFTEALLGGRGAEVTAILRGAYRAGLAIETLADRLIAPVMQRIGHDWESARIDVWQEHRGTQLCAAALYDLKDELEARAERNRPLAVGGAPEGDPYLLATLLAQLVLLDAGWEVVNLGPNTPLKSLSAALGQLRPRLSWLSISHVEEPADFLAAYREFHHAADRQGVPLAIGGRALTEPLRSILAYTMYGDGLSQLAAFARTLHPRPKPPRPGRPSRHKETGRGAPTQKGRAGR